MPDDDLMNFFAVTRSDCLTVKRIPVDRKLQEILTGEFASQENDFLSASTDVIPYDPGYQPDDSEMFVVEGFVLPAPLSTATEAVDGVDPVSGDDIELDAIKAVFALVPSEREQPPKLLFQSFTSAQSLKRGRSLLFSRQVFRRVEDPGILVGNRLSAVFRDGNLYFRSIHLVNRFIDLAELFQEATDKELDSFCAHVALFVENAKDIVSVCDSWMRRRVAFILASKILDNVSAKRIVAVSKPYGLTVKIRRANGKEVVELPRDKKELKRLIRFLAEEYLQSELTTTRFQVNSKRKV